MLSNIVSELRNSKTTVSLLVASLSLIYTYIEVRTSFQSKRSILGRYLRNFTFSFIIIYLAISLYRSSATDSTAKSITSHTIHTGRPNF